MRSAQFWGVFVQIRVGVRTNAPEQTFRCSGRGEAAVRPGQPGPEEAAAGPGRGAARCPKHMVGTFNEELLFSHE